MTRTRAMHATIRPMTSATDVSERRRALRRRRRSLRSPSTRSCRTAIRARSSRRTAGSAGCASRASTRRACSARCWTGRRVTSGSPRSPPTCPRRASTSRAPTRWSPPGRCRPGWIVVRDALTLGPRRIEDRITPHTRPPFDDDADHLLVRTVECIEGSVEIDLICEPVFDYGRVAAEWTLVGDDRHVADVQGAGVTLRLATDLPLGIEGDRVRARRLLKEGERAFCSLSWAEELASPADVDEASAHLAATTRVLALLDRPRPDPRSPLARADPALCARDQGSHLHADRRDGRGAHDVAARDARRRAQLGLPLHLDPRRHVHAAGAALAQPRLGGRRVHAVHRRPRARRRRLAADHVRDRRAARPDRVDASTSSRATPARARCGSATARSTSARTTSTAPRWTRSCCTRAAASGSRGGCGRSWRPRPRTPRACGASPTRGSGRRAASRSTTSPPS